MFFGPIRGTTLCLMWLDQDCKKYARLQLHKTCDSNMIKLQCCSKSSCTKLRSFVVVQVVGMYFKVCKIATLWNLPLFEHDALELEIVEFCI
jgi:hypothetical protein